MAQYHVVTLFCIEHYLALIAACMPTLGPFFNWLRPSYWKHSIHIALGPKTKTYDDAEAFQHGWPRHHTLMSLDNSFKHSSIEGPDKAAVKNVELPFWFGLQLYREQSARSVGNVTRLYNFEEREEPSNSGGQRGYVGVAETLRESWECARETKVLG